MVCRACGAYLACSTCPASAGIEFIQIGAQVRRQQLPRPDSERPGDLLQHVDPDAGALLLDACGTAWPDAGVTRKAGQILPAVGALHKSEHVRPKRPLGGSWRVGLVHPDTV